MERVDLRTQVPLLHTKRVLVPAELESVLRRGQRPVFTAKGWPDEVRSFGLLVDLSRIEWVELSATVRVALLIERALLDGISVTLATPLERARRTEEYYSDPSNGKSPAKRRELLARQGRRRAARRFLDRLQFLAAVQAPHLASAPGELTVVADYDSSLDLDQASAVQEAEEEELREFELEEVEPYIVPLTWLTPDSREATKEVVRHFVSVVDSRGRGVDSRLDAEALADVVLHELVDNAVRHSETERALVAAFAQPKSLVSRPQDYLACERGFATWLGSMDRSNVEVVVGDSGVGIPARLGPAYDATEGLGVPKLERGRDASVLAWAFNRLSSSLASPRSGTRGLYRVDRIVKRHLGLLTIRSAGELVGWDHGGLTHDVLVFAAGRKESLGVVPGTVVRVQMIAVPDRPPKRAGGEPPGNLSFEFGSVRLEEGGGALVNGRPLETLIGSATADTCWVLVPEQDLATKEEFEALFTTLAAGRDPETIVVLGVPHFQLASDGATAVNMAIEEGAQHREDAEAKRYEVSDPVLVIGRRAGDLAWTGTTEGMAALLLRLLEAPGAKLNAAELEEAAPAAEIRSEIATRLRRDSGLATLVDGGVQLRLHLRAIVDGVAERFGERVRDQVEKSASRGVRVTPSLASVRGWVDVEKLFEAPHDLTLAYFALARRAQVELDLDRPPTLLLADASVDGRRLGALCTALGVTRKETIPGEAGVDGSEGVEIAEPGDRVVVYADLISSGESVCRCLSQILRDGAVPLAVFCVVDAREQVGEAIDLWGRSISVISLVQHSTWAKLGPGEEPVFVNAHGQDEPLPPAPPEYLLKPDRLMELATAAEAVHVGHIGGNTGRHFTFYVNAQRLLDGPELKEELLKRVARWAEDRKPDRPVEVWYPRPEPKVSRPAEVLAGVVVDANDGFRRRGVGRQRVWGGWKFPLTLRGADLATDTEVVIVDWGALEGASLMEMIRLAGEGGASRILACVCLSQLPPEAEWHLRALRKLEVRQQEPAENLLDDQPSRKRQIGVEVEFLSAIPVRSFGVRDCPVCEQLNRLAEHEMPTIDMRRFGKEQREQRLHLTSREKAAEQKVQRLDGSPLGGERSVAMLTIRRRLEAALPSTRLRFELVKDLVDLARRFEGAGDPTCVEEAQDWVRLLALEPQWLGRPPLVLDEARQQIAAIAARIAVLETTTPDDRAMAIATLRVGSKELFAEQAPAIFRVSYEEPLARGQLFYGLLTYIDRPYLQSPEIWHALVDTLEAMRSAIWNGEVPDSAGSVEVTVLLERATLRRGVADLAEIPGPKVWKQLRELLDFATTRHQEGRPIRHLEGDISRDAPSSYDTERLARLEEGVPEDWSRVESFLRDKVLPRLNNLRPTLNGPTAVTTFGPHLGWLTELIDQQAGVAEWPISEIAARVKEGREHFHEDVVWDRFVTEFNRLAKVLLRQRQPPRGQGEPAAPEPARLIQFLDTVPADLPAAIEYARTTCSSDLIESVETVGNIPKRLDVYFPNSELKELLAEVLDNVDKHHVSRSRDESDESPPSSRADLFASVG